MSAFSAEWLTLREPADAAARSIGLTRALGERFASSPELTVLDLGTGTGANLRFLAPHLPARQQWLLVDHDADLLARVPSQMEHWSGARGDAVTADGHDLLVRGLGVECRLAMRKVDLQKSVHDDSLFEDRALITASALLDLVSERWLDALAMRCAAQRACLLFALTYDGRIECSPSEPEDDTIRELVNRHQRTDKGFGPALGPHASSAAHEHLTRAGYDVRREPSDWRLESDASALQYQLIDGWASAARAMAPERAASIEHWRASRHTHVDAGRSRIVVGHEDLAAWPANREEGRRRV